MAMIAHLTDCSDNTEVEIYKIVGGRGAKRNIFESGLDFGCSVKIIYKYAKKGPVTLSRDGKIIKIGNQLASKIIVKTEEKIHKRLSDFFVGDIVEVIQNNSMGEVRNRLLDMGIVKGERLEILRLAPLGDPIEVRVNNFDLTLRIKEAKQIEAKLIDIKRISSGGRWEHLFSFNRSSKV